MRGRVTTTTARHILDMVLMYAKLESEPASVVVLL